MKTLAVKVLKKVISYMLDGLKSILKISFGLLKFRGKFNRQLFIIILFSVLRFNFV